MAHDRVRDSKKSSRHHPVMTNTTLMKKEKKKEEEETKIEAVIQSIGTGYAQAVILNATVFNLFKAIELSTSFAHEILAAIKETNSLPPENLYYRNLLIQSNYDTLELLMENLYGVHEKHKSIKENYVNHLENLRILISNLDQTSEDCEMYCDYYELKYDNLHKLQSQYETIPIGTVEKLFSRCQLEAWRLSDKCKKPNSYEKKRPEESTALINRSLIETPTNTPSSTPSNRSLQTTPTSTPSGTPLNRSRAPSSAFDEKDTLRPLSSSGTSSGSNLSISIGRHGQFKLKRRYSKEQVIIQTSENDIKPSCPIL